MARNGTAGKPAGALEYALHKVLPMIAHPLYEARAVGEVIRQHDFADGSWQGGEPPVNRVNFDFL